VQVLVRAQSRSITLRLDHATRQAVLVLPHARHLRRAKKLLAQKEQWLERQWQALPQPMPFADQGWILLGGKKVQLVFAQGRGKASLRDDQFVVPATRAHAFADRVRRALIEQARSELQISVKTHAQNLDVVTGRITVRDTRSRWGSCSAAGNLNFSWRLICAPGYVLDYVAAHEVAHLREANHSRNFWQLVENSYGPTSLARAWLRKQAPNLFAVGARR
jgi:predicted metal-dependent hydrolase